MLVKEEIPEGCIKEDNFSLEPGLQIKEEKHFLNGLLNEVIIKKEVNDNLECDKVKVEICEDFDVKIKTEDNLSEDFREDDEKLVHSEAVQEINQDIRTLKRKLWSSLIGQKFSLVSSKEEGEEEKSCLRCDKCLLNFQSEEDLMDHKQNHSHTFFQCLECNQVFEQFFSLKIHQACHETVKRYKCDICCKTFTRKYGLKIHVLSHSDEKVYQCEVCKKYYKNKLSLTSHFRYHFKDKKYKCPVCKKLFWQPCELRKHLESHRNSKNYKCDICCKWYSYVSLKRHLKSHFKTERHSCDECGKCFKQNSSLLFHKRSKHLGIRPFKCEDCDKTFARSRNLRIHMNKHRVLQIQNTIEIVNQ